MNIKLLSLASAFVAMAMSTQSAYAHEEHKDEKKKLVFADLTVEQVQAAIKEGKVSVIDVNGVGSYNKAHVPGAHHFKTLKRKGLKKVLSPDKSALVVAYCGGPQ